MTEDVKALAERWKDMPEIGPTSSALIALSRAYLALLAKEAARGEVRQECPRCHNFDQQQAWRKDKFSCLECGNEYATADFWQRIPAPEAPH